MSSHQTESNERLIELAVRAAQKFSTKGWSLETDEASITLKRTDERGEGIISVEFLPDNVRVTGVFVFARDKSTKDLTDLRSEFALPNRGLQRSDQWIENEIVYKLQRTAAGIRPRNSRKDDVLAAA